MVFATGTTGSLAPNRISVGTLILSSVGSESYLIHFAWKRIDPVNPTWSGWFRAAGSGMPQSGSQLTFSDESHAIQAAVAGQGAALLSLALVADELAAGRLVQPFGPTMLGMTYHLVEPSDWPHTPQAAAARDWLLSELEIGRRLEDG